MSLLSPRPRSFLPACMGPASLLSSAHLDGSQWTAVLGGGEGGVQARDGQACDFFQTL